MNLNDSDIEPLRYMSNLEELDLNVNWIKDISPLSSLTNLERISLGWNKISDISALSGLKNLTYLQLIGNPLTVEQVNTLRRALPNCTIIF